MKSRNRPLVCWGLFCAKDRILFIVITTNSGYTSMTLTIRHTGNTILFHQYCIEMFVKLVIMFAMNTVLMLESSFSCNKRLIFCSTVNLKAQELPGASPPGPPLGLCPRPRWGPWRPPDPQPYQSHFAPKRTPPLLGLATGLPSFPLHPPSLSLSLLCPTCLSLSFFCVFHTHTHTPTHTHRAHSTHLSISISLFYLLHGNIFFLIYVLYQLFTDCSFILFFENISFKSLPYFDSETS